MADQIYFHNIECPCQSCAEARERSRTEFEIERQQRIGAQLREDAKESWTLYQSQRERQEWKAKISEGVRAAWKRNGAERRGWHTKSEDERQAVRKKQSESAKRAWILRRKRFAED